MILSSQLLYNYEACDCLVFTGRINNGYNYFSCFFKCIWYTNVYVCTDVKMSLDNPNSLSYAYMLHPVDTPVITIIGLILSICYAFFSLYQS